MKTSKVWGWGKRCLEDREREDSQRTDQASVGGWDIATQKHTDLDVELSAGLYHVCLPAAILPAVVIMD
ncbi:hypothetical protein STEG23_023704 [Scotinomys teguina]